MLFRKAKMPKKIRNNLIIELHVPDFDLARQFYSAIGFSVIDDEPIGPELGYLVMMRRDALGDTILNFYGGDNRVFQHAFFRDLPSSTPRGYAVEITIPVKKLERYYSTIVSKIEPNIVQRLTTKAWGQKDFRLRDPFGFYIRFTELVEWGQP